MRYEITRYTGRGAVSEVGPRTGDPIDVWAALRNLVDGFWLKVEVRDLATGQLTTFRARSALRDNVVAFPRRASA